jgi:hypothetical protein
MQGCGGRLSLQVIPCKVACVHHAVASLVDDVIVDENHLIHHLDEQKDNK